MTTKKEIIKRALIRVGRVPFDQVPTSDQESLADFALKSLHEHWVDKGSARWELDDIPDQITNALVSVLAFALVDDFGVSGERYQRLAVADREAKVVLSAYNEIPYSGQTIMQEY